MNHLVKYERIWDVYQAKYDSMENVQQIKQKKEEIRALEEKSE